jgi:hypothetical protein
VYRDLLKVVRRYAKGDHSAGFVSQEFRKNTALKDLTDVRYRIDLAKDCSFLVRSVHAHKVRLYVACLMFLCDFFPDRGTVDVLWIFLLVICHA